jgi:hypothetical protein
MPKARTGYVVVAVCYGRSSVRCGDGWGYDAEPFVYCSRPEAVKALHQFKSQRSPQSPVKFSVMALREWDRLRIQQLISS